MHSRHHLKTAAVMLAALGLSAGLTLPSLGCTGGPRGATSTEAQSPERTATTPAVPALDTRAPAAFETATFALG